MSSLPQFPSILVIDADEVACQFACAALMSHGYQTTPAADIAAAIWAASNRNCDIDLIICDVQVEQQSGIEIVEAIQRLPFRSDVPALFTSQRQVADIVLKRHATGGAYYIKKPYDLELLFELVDRSLWMPHLVNSHIEKFHSAHSVATPHAPFSSVRYPSAINTSSFVN